MVKLIIKILSIIMVLSWMVVIFLFSAQPSIQSNSLSEDVTKVIVETKENISSENNASVNKENTSIKVLVYKLNGLVRKSAHFTAYFILGMLAAIVLKLFNVSNSRLLLIASVICFLYACSDEIHQMFVPGRTALFTDVLIDFSGALIGIGFFWLVNKLIDNRKKAY